MLREQLASPPEGSNFFITDDNMDDEKLYYSALMLQCCLSDVIGYIKRHESQSGTSDKTGKALVKEVATAVANLDAKLRTDVRSGNLLRNKAKNALTRLQHGLEYQAGTSAARTGALAKADLVKDKATGMATNQTSLNGFIRRPKPTVKSAA